MAIKLFGFTISREDEEIDKRNQEFATPVSDDGATTIQTSGFNAGGYFGTYVDMDATAKSEAELITRYREASAYSDCSAAVDEIVTEAIAAVDDEQPVQINLDSVDISEDIKDTIEQEFDRILQLLEFNNKGHDIFRRWYIDGRIYYQKIIDMKNPKRGIMELIQLDPRKVRKIKEVKREKDKETNLLLSSNNFHNFNSNHLNKRGIRGS
jgi:hypothetical protein